MQKETIKLEGSPILEVLAMAEQESFDLFVSLSIIEEGSEEVSQLSTGVLRVMDKQAQKLSVRKVILQPLFADIKIGSKIRLSISGAAWPAIAVNSGTLQNSPRGINASCIVTTICLQLLESKLSICPVITK